MVAGVVMENPWATAVVKPNQVRIENGMRIMNNKKREELLTAVCVCVCLCVKVGGEDKS